MTMPPAGAGADDHAEDHLGVTAGAVEGLRQGETVGIVGDADGASQGHGQIPIQGLSDQPRSVCILHQSGGR